MIDTVCETHCHDFLGRSGFSLGKMAFGHVIPLGSVAGCGVGENKKQGRERVKSGTAGLGVAICKRVRCWRSSGDERMQHDGARARSGLAR